MSAHRLRHTVEGMLRKTLLAVPLLALLLPLTGLPASAAPAPPAATVGAATDSKATAWVRSPHHGLLKKGCRGHRFRYGVTSPKGDSWALEVFLIDKKGRRVASSYKASGGDAAKGKGRLVFCSLQVRPGRYKVKGRLTWSHYSQEAVTWTKAVRVKLRRP